MKNGLHFYREDRKIDFGFSEEMMMVSDEKSTKIVMKRTEHWVDREGKNLTNIRSEEVEVKSDPSSSVFDVTSKSILKTVSDLFQMDGKMHLDFKQRLANGIFDWVVNQNKGKTELDYKNKCLKIESYDLPKESYKNSHLINLCAHGRASNDDLFKFEYIKPQLNNKIVQNNEKILFKLSRAEEQQLRLTMHWSPEQLGEWIVEFGEFAEKTEKEQNSHIAKLQSELEHKFSLLKDSLMNDVVLPMRKHRQEEFHKIVQEINPKLAAKLRSKRAALRHKNDTEISFASFSENLAKKLFNLKVVKFSLEDGQLEILFKTHPSFEGFKYGLKSSLKYLFKE